jgi:hypothetical protein
MIRHIRNKDEYYLGVPPLVRSGLSDLKKGCFVSVLGSSMLSNCGTIGVYEICTVKL